MKGTLALALLAFTGAPEIAWADEAEDVLRRMHQLNQVVVKAASLAQSRAVRGDVRSFAHRLEMDHRFVAHEMLDMAEELDVKLSTADVAEPDPELERYQQVTERLGELETLRGPEFELAFVRLMRIAHLFAIDLLSSAQGDLSPGLVRALDRLIPIYEQHVELAAHLAGGSEATARR